MLKDESSKQEDYQMIKKILIVSDSHGNSKNIKLAIDREMPDMLIHLGDIEDDPETIRAWLDKAVQVWNAMPGNESMKKGLPIPAVFIEGNCDRYRYGATGEENLLKKVSVFRVNGHGFYCTHGHREGVNYGLDNLYYSALENNCDIAMYGHTHVPFDDFFENSSDARSDESDNTVRGVRVLNPGSVSLPRGGNRKSYMIMTFEEDGSYEVELKYL